MKNSNIPKGTHETTELKEVVKQTISSIAAAIVELSQDEELIKTGCVVSPSNGTPSGKKDISFLTYQDPNGTRMISNVDFHLAITQTNRTTGGGGIGISVVNLGLKQGVEMGVTNTISFSVPVVWPVSNGRNR